MILGAMKDANRIVSVKAPENVGMSSEVLHRVNKVALSG